MEFIQIAKTIKKDIEQIECHECEDAKLTFKTVLLEDDFMLEEGGYATVDAYCKRCETVSAVVVKLIASDE